VWNDETMGAESCRRDSGKSEEKSGSVPRATVESSPENDDEILQQVLEGEEITAAELPRIAAQIDDSR